MFRKKKPTTVPWTGKEANARDAAKQLAKETARMAKDGYDLASSAYIAAGKHNTVLKAVIFLPLAFRGNSKVIPTATFTLRA